MKELCDKLMRLNPELPFGTDYSPLALALFLREAGFSKSKEYSIEEFTKFLYRFYSDIPEAKKKHYYNLINELWHYQPTDFYEYAKNVLGYIKTSTGLIIVGSTSFALSYCPDNVGDYYPIIENVLQVMITKYIGEQYKGYDSRIRSEEYKNKDYFLSSDRVFYRAYEVLNYCFISDEMNLDNLCAVRLMPKMEYDPYNYLILEKQYGELYKNHQLTIKKNGYAYLNEKRLMSHIEISALKKIRGNLEDYQEVR